MNYGTTNPFNPSLSTMPAIPPLQNPYNGQNYYNLGSANRSVIPGRSVYSLEEIQIIDVPQDGSIALFPKNDGSCIWAKSWDSNGNIRTRKFVLDQDEEGPQTEQPMSMGSTANAVDLVSKIDNLTDMVGLLTDSLTGPTKVDTKNQNGSSK